MSEPPPTNEAELEDLLSRPSPADVQFLARLEGDILVLGAGGKMGPSLVRLAQRASDEAGVQRTVTAVSRFTDSVAADRLAAAGVDTLALDLLEPEALDQLRDAPNVIYMAGQKFGTAADPASTWALNALLPGLVMRRFASSRLVVFSTGNVYPFVPVDSVGSVETDPLAPVGEYAQSATARERIVTFFSQRQRTPVSILRLNYAVELRYGVIRDLADKIWRREAIDLSMGYVNVIWQRDANSVALRSLAHCEVPPFVVNVTGSEKLSVRALAERLGDRLGLMPQLSGSEAETALLSDASRCRELFGPVKLETDTMVDWVAGWVRHGGRSFGKPTHFDEREGEF
jgi:nucleoside-diphosphate-sugar epimerase